MSELVHITWRDPASDWPYFYLLETRGEWVKLQGADYPDGSATHEGDVFMAHKDDIRAMRVVGKGGQLCAS